jgi:hypothetical protein
MVVVASLDDPQIAAGTWERARTATAPRRERTAKWGGERSSASTWAHAWTRDKTATAPFARVD